MMKIPGSRRISASRLRRFARNGHALLVASVLLALGCLTPVARGSVSLLVEQPYGGFGVWNPTGHSALYFDHICAATPVQLRPCGPGELGVVLSRYDGIQEYDWVATPLIPYLYAVESAADVPDRVDRLTVLRMRDLYRREHLQMVAPDTAAGGMPQGNWYELVGSAYDRTIYGFRVDSSPEQDAGIIAMFNDRPNVTHYSGAFRNCADFVRVVLNRIYPHAIRRDFVADFGLTTPKSVARGLAHYGRKHPEAGLQVFQVPQVEGDLPRSVGIEGVTESLLKRYGLPLALLSPDVTAAVAVAYVGHGRFAMPKDAPLLDVASLQAAAELRATQSATASGNQWPAVADVPFLDGAPITTTRGLYLAEPLLGDAAPATLLSPVDCPGCVENDLLP